MTTLTKPEQMWWPERHYMLAQQLLTLLKTQLKPGDIAKASSLNFKGRKYRIAVVGDSFAGKSAFLNTVNTSWNFPEQTRQWERFPEGQPSIPGTCRFDGPHVLHKSDGSALFELYDISGFTSQSLEQCLAIPVAIYDGAVKPGEWTLGGTGEILRYQVLSIDQNFNGVDLIILIAPLLPNSAVQEKIDRAMQLHLKLRAQGINSYIVVTHCKELKCEYITGTFGNVPHACIDSYAREAERNEETDTCALRILADAVVQIEVRPKGVRVSYGALKLKELARAASKHLRRRPDIAADATVGSVAIASSFMFPVAAPYLAALAVVIVTVRRCVAGGK